MAISSSTDCMSNRTRSSIFDHEWTAEDIWAPWQVLSDYLEYQPWFFSLLGSAMVGLSGIFPLLVIPIDEAVDLKQGDSAKTLKILLSFAVGGLLGDVFLHLLPEAWANHAAPNIEKSSSDVLNHASMECGLWVLCGFLVFVIAEKMFNSNSGNDENINIRVKTSKRKIIQSYDNNNCTELNTCSEVNKNGQTIKLKCLKKHINGLKPVNGYKNGYENDFTEINCLEPLFNGYCVTKDSSNLNEKLICKKKTIEERLRERPKHISGYLNLMANCVDNFTHGLAVGGSFLVSFRLGALTTFAILIHEIPHEIGDFAILLKSGFNRWDAAKAQIMTATGGICGAFVAVVCSGDAIESRTSWILPFTAGGFLHIGLVNVLPELLKETNPRESLKQMGALLIGIVVMAILTIMCD